MIDTTEVRKILQGKTVFVGDVLDSKAYWVKAKRSTVAHGFITGFVFPSLPETVQVIRLRDIPGKPAVTLGKEEVPLLNETEVRYIGEPILLLIGPNIETLEELIDQIVVLYQELPANFDISDNPEEPPEAVLEKTVVQGDPDSAFSRASQILEKTYTTGIQDYYASESHGAYVHWEHDEATLNIYCSSRWPFHVHRTVQECLAIPWELVSVTLPPDPDISLDGKLWFPSFVSAHAALAAWISRRAIKCIYSREEDFLFSPKRVSSLIMLKGSLDPEGNLSALEGDIRFNMGAYPILTEELLDRAIFALGSAYGCPNVRIRARAFRTNLPPAGPLTGMGESQVQFARERFFDEICQALEEPPLDWKRRNLSSRYKPGPWGTTRKPNSPDPELLNRLQELSDFQRRHAALELIRKRRSENSRTNLPLEGIGIAFGEQGAGFFVDREQKGKVEIQLQNDGKVLLSCSAFPESYTLPALWKQEVAKSLGVPFQSVQWRPIRTSSVPDSGPSVFSRNVVLITKLINLCCNQINKKKDKVPLPIREIKSFNPRYSRSWDRESFQGDPFLSISWAAAVVEVQVDPISLIPEIQNIWMTIDAGRILDEDEARHTIELGIAQAVGWVLKEQLQYIEGKIPQELFQNYRICSTLDFPSPYIEFVSSEGTVVKGIGELALSVIPAALASALSQALNISLREIPYKTEVE
jgi:CO/xanthine dehydrogenase Mo-binding subunit